jgi:hypothetical protein
VTHEEGDFNQLRAQLGNDIAMKACREGTLPFPDGAIIVALHWKRVASDEDNKVFGQVQAFVAGPRVNMQVMVKDSKKYASTGGWGFGDFTEGKPADEAKHKTCFACHEPAKAHDFRLHPLRTLINSLFEQERQNDATPECTAGERNGSRHETRGRRHSGLGHRARKSVLPELRMEAGR